MLNLWLCSNKCHVILNARKWILGNELYERKCSLEGEKDPSKEHIDIVFKQYKVSFGTGVKRVSSNLRRQPGPHPWKIWRHIKDRFQPGTGISYRTYKRRCALEIGLQTPPKCHRRNKCVITTNDTANPLEKLKVIVDSMGCQDDGYSYFVVILIVFHNLGNLLLKRSLAFASILFFPSFIKSIASVLIVYISQYFDKLLFLFSFQVPNWCSQPWLMTMPRFCARKGLRFSSDSDWV